MMLYDEDHEVRRVRMYQPHPPQVTPSWYGDSVGRYEGDTLVIDTVGFKIGPFSAVDQYGTPFTQALHVVERYRLIDYEAAKEAWERGGKENGRGGGIGETWAPDPNYKGTAASGEPPHPLRRIGHGDDDRRRQRRHHGFANEQMIALFLCAGEGAGASRPA
jgi:hypothetical protein